ncbi:Photosystem II 5 kDa protein [Hibiscus syriacus]|uniref:Photosystem II 5 kDa protein n=1 Tax=Hibiscus syriacus TaxID=106335 RepID=A0A6A3CGA7_HIBSY|nr:photosystem II 5 kDa protein, chloroplastic-like [Hibiscus syriacus]KAE8728375.1 Photosystem II 5 kDa protein [Hibiscus syriacus]
MASMSMAGSLLPSSNSTLTRLPWRRARRGAIVAKAASAGQSEKVDLEMKRESSNGRRELIFAATAAAACSFANVAMGEEPKRGTPEAKKKYAPVCVTMPTASICRK